MADIGQELEKKCISNLKEMFLMEKARPFTKNLQYQEEIDKYKSFLQKHKSQTTATVSGFEGKYEEANGEYWLVYDTKIKPTYQSKSNPRYTIQHLSTSQDNEPRLGICCDSTVIHQIRHPHHSVQNYNNWGQIRPDNRCETSKSVAVEYSQLSNQLLAIREECFKIDALWKIQSQSMIDFVCKAVWLNLVVNCYQSQNELQRKITQTSDVTCTEQFKHLLHLNEGTSKQQRQTEAKLESYKNALEILLKHA